jgi:hypothetical protein
MEISRGVFIRLTIEEDEILWEGVEEAGCERSPEGLKEFIFKALESERGQIIAERLVEKGITSSLEYIRKKIGLI